MVPSPASEAVECLSSKYLLVSTSDAAVCLAQHSQCWLLRHKTGCRSLRVHTLSFLDAAGIASKVGDATRTCATKRLRQTRSHHKLQFYPINGASGSNWTRNKISRSDFLQ
ncbi:hypothetical protein AVEN_28539-1 [Araneus ventricosus]|uniref:Uncharacterized protein n=1 Tax=Araneus ventricosus TaxID=182803 RepID=A0A4Y2T5D8_ARAVE|nr:hypothetical protein AVEN_28539-1 [Araneus ventricosus]